MVSSSIEAYAAFEAIHISTYVMHDARIRSGHEFAS